jgi:hypothetical protein
MKAKAYGTWPGRGAGLVALSLLMTWGRTAAAELPPAPARDVEPSAEARHEFQLGVDMLQDPDGARYEEAYRQFLRAYTLSPSWKILGNLGLSAFKLERFADGIEAYQRYLKAAGPDIDPSERQQIERDLEFMKSSAGSVTLNFSGAGGAISVQDTRQRAVGGPIISVYDVGAVPSTTLRLMAGTHTLNVSAGAKHASVDVVLQSGATETRNVDLDASPTATATPGAGTSQAGAGVKTDRHPSGSGLRTTGLVVGGVGVLAIVGGVVTFVMGSGKKGDLDKKCPQSTCSYATEAERQSFEDDKSSLKTLGMATTALWIGGGVLTATGATLFVIGGSSSEKAAVAFGPGPDGTGFGVQARGSF